MCWLHALTWSDGPDTAACIEPALDFEEPAARIRALGPGMWVFWGPGCKTQHGQGPCTGTDPADPCRGPSFTWLVPLTRRGAGAGGGGGQGGGDLSTCPLCCLLLAFSPSRPGWIGDMTGGGGPQVTNDT